MSDSAPSTSPIGEGDALRRQVQRVLPLFPVLATQLSETRAQVENAVVGVSTNFAGMAQRAHESVETAKHLIDGGDSGQSDGTVTSLVTTSQSTLEALMQRIVKGGELSMKAVYRMDDVEGGMQRIREILSDVNDVATRTRLLTVNAKIEAARVGEQGKGFAVVASEISQLSVKSAEIVVSITEILAKLSADVSATVADLRDLASADMNDVLLGKEQVGRVIEDFQTKQRELEARVREMTQSGEQLANDISAAVVAMQFQDRVSQRIEHVIQAVSGLHEHLAQTLDGRLEAAPHEGDLIDRMRGSYTMQEERLAAFDAHSQPAALPSSGDAALTQDVVLF